MVTEEQRREKKTERKMGMRGTKMSTLREKRKKEERVKEKQKRQRGEGPEGWKTDWCM